MTTTTLSPTMKELLERVQASPEGSRNLYRAQRLAAVSRQLRETARRKGVSVRDLANAMGTSPSQAQRMLANAAPANLTLESVFRAADALGVEVDFRLRDRAAGSYYVQRGAFPTLREVTILASPPLAGSSTFEDHEDLAVCHGLVGAV